MWRAPWGVYESYCQAPGSVWQLFGPILALGAGDWVRTADCNPRAATGCALNSCCWQLYLNYHTIMSILSLFFIFIFLLVELPCLGVFTRFTTALFST